MSLSSLSTSKRKYGNQWDMRSPPAKRRTVSPPSSERSAASPSSMSDTLSPPLIGPRLPPGWAPTPRAPSPSSPPPPRRAPSPPSPPTNPRDLHATNNFGEGVYFQQPRQHAWDSDGEPADPGMGWTRQRLSWWNPQWVWDRAAINRPDGRYCETCVGDYAATDYSRPRMARPGMASTAGVGGRKGGRAGLNKYTGSPGLSPRPSPRTRPSPSRSSHTIPGSTQNTGMIRNSSCPGAMDTTEHGSGAPARSMPTRRGGQTAIRRRLGDSGRPSGPPSLVGGGPRPGNSSTSCWN